MAIIKSMTHMTSLLPASPLGFLNPETLLTAAGQWAFVVVLLIVFAECGLLIGFFLPGDSLLFATGLFIATGLIDVPLWLALILIPLAAIIGNLVGYWIGYRVGPALFRKEDSKIFKKEYVEKTSEFFNEYGKRAIIMARFVPIVRTFITAMAGVAKMNYRDYAMYSIVGGIIWGTGLTWLGAILGKIKFVADNIELMAILIIIISFIPVFLERRKAKSQA
jgi:membrane-associated protein